MANTGRQRVSYVIPPPSSPPPLLRLPPSTTPRNGQTSPLLLYASNNSYPHNHTHNAHNGNGNGWKSSAATGSTQHHDGRALGPGHPQHRLGITSFALDTSTMLQGRSTPSGILYTGGRDGMLMAWDLALPMRPRSTFPSPSNPTSPSSPTTPNANPNRNSTLRGKKTGTWERLTADEDDLNLIEEEDADEEWWPPTSDGDIIGDVVPAGMANTRTMAASEELPYEKRWELDVERVENGIPSYWRQHTQAHTDWVNDILLCNLNQTVISASSDGTVKAWNPHDPYSQGPSTIGTHSDYVRCLAQCTDRKWILSGSFDRTIKIWDSSLSSSSSQKPQTPIQTLHPSTPPTPSTSPKHSIYALSTTPSAHLVAAGGPERVIRTWDARSGKRTHAKLVGHTDCIRAIEVSWDGRYILSASADGSVKVWAVAALPSSATLQSIGALGSGFGSAGFGGGSPGVGGMRTAGLGVGGSGGQRCLHTFTHHTDSVWSLYVPDEGRARESLETFYSGDREGWVCRVDLEGCRRIGDGECIALLKDGHGYDNTSTTGTSTYANMGSRTQLSHETVVGTEGVSRILAMDDAYLWTASGSSSVRRWRIPQTRAIRTRPGYKLGQPVPIQPSCLPLPSSQTQAQTKTGAATSDSVQAGFDKGREREEKRTSLAASFLTDDTASVYSQSYSLLNPSLNPLNSSTSHNPYNAYNQPQQYLDSRQARRRDEDNLESSYDSSWWMKDGIPYSALIRLSSPNDASTSLSLHASTYPVSGSSIGLGISGRGGMGMLSGSGRSSLSPPPPYTNSPNRSGIGLGIGRGIGAGRNALSVPGQVQGQPQTQVMAEEEITLTPYEAYMQREVVPDAIPLLSPSFLSSVHSAPHSTSASPHPSVPPSPANPDAHFLSSTNPVSPGTGTGGPDFINPGAHGLVRVLILNDRMHALTVDTAGDVMIWDIVRCICLGVFERGEVWGALEEENGGQNTGQHRGQSQSQHQGQNTNTTKGTAPNKSERDAGLTSQQQLGQQLKQKSTISPRQALELVKERIEGEAVVNGWCAADTKIGNLTIHVNERCFDAEVFADEVGFPPTNTTGGGGNGNGNGGTGGGTEDQRINVGKWVLRNLFIGFVHEEQRILARAAHDKAHHSHQRSSSASASASSTTSHSATLPTTSHSSRSRPTNPFLSHSPPPSSSHTHSHPHPHSPLNPLHGRATGAGAGAGTGIGMSMMGHTSPTPIPAAIPPDANALRAHELYTITQSPSSDDMMTPGPSVSASHPAGVSGSMPGAGVGMVIGDSLPTPKPISSSLSSAGGEIHRSPSTGAVSTSSNTTSTTATTTVVNSHESDYFSLRRKKSVTQTQPTTGSSTQTLNQNQVTTPTAIVSKTGGVVDDDFSAWAGPGSAGKKDKDTVLPPLPSSGTSNSNTTTTTTGNETIVPATPTTPGPTTTSASGTGTGSFMGKLKSLGKGSGSGSSRKVASEGDTPGIVVSAPSESDNTDENTQQTATRPILQRLKTQPLTPPSGHEAPLLTIPNDVVVMISTEDSDTSSAGGWTPGYVGMTGVFSVGGAGGSGGGGVTTMTKQTTNPFLSHSSSTSPKPSHLPDRPSTPPSNAASNAQITQELTLLETTMPDWLLEFLLWNKAPSIQVTKISFVLLPWVVNSEEERKLYGDTLPELLNTSQTKLTAGRFLRVRKLTNHVQEKLEKPTSVSSSSTTHSQAQPKPTTNSNTNSSPRSSGDTARNTNTTSANSNSNPASDTVTNGNTNGAGERTPFSSPPPYLPSSSSAAAASPSSSPKHSPKLLSRSHSHSHTSSHTSSSKSHTSSTSNSNSTSTAKPNQKHPPPHPQQHSKKQRKPAEEMYEILCNDTVLSLDMTLAAVRQFVWRQSGELVMYYRRKGGCF